jgi:prolyl-tRNA editing enzyme YbaK/EbsC (Cys-tRNA(Pro) deacylase)
MSQSEHPSVTKFRKAAADLGVKGEVIQTKETARTADEAAATLGVQVGQIVKSLVFEADGETVLVLTSGENKVDTDKVAIAFNVGKADADKTREVTGYAIGGVPPLGHSTKMKILIDETFKKFDEIWAAAGHPHFVFPTTYEELIKLSGAIPTDVALKG